MEKGQAEGPAPGIPLERLEQKDLKFLPSLGYTVTPCLTKRRKLLQGKRKRHREKGTEKDGNGEMKKQRERQAGMVNKQTLT